MKLTLLFIGVIISLGLANAAYFNDVSIRLGNTSAWIEINQTTFDNFTKYDQTDNPANTLQFYINGSRINLTAGTNKTITNPSFNNLTDNFTISVNGTPGYFNFSAIMLNANNNYTLTSNGGFVESKLSTSDKTVWFNYIGSYPTSLTVRPSAVVYAPNITSWSNDLTSDSSLDITVNAGNTITFSVGANQTITSWSWGGANQLGGGGTTNSTASETFSVVGDTSVTSQGSNVNGSTQIITWVVHVVSSGGGGTNWDYVYGWVNWSNGTMVNGASVATSVGTEYTNINGYYTFGYQFVHGNTYNFNISKNGIWDNKTITFSSGDYQIVNGTLATPISPNAPNITSWSNDNTSNNNLSLTVFKNTNITFNVTSNQTITTWSWVGATQINGSGSNKSYAYHNFTSVGVQTVSAQGTNTNGSTQIITWTITVQGFGGITLEGYVNNILELNLENARIDFDGLHTFTDATGHYQFNNVNEGDYSILARAIGYENLTKTETINNNIVVNFTLQEKTWATTTDASNAGAMGFVGGLMGGALIIAVIRRRRRL